MVAESEGANSGSSQRRGGGRALVYVVLSFIMSGCAADQANEGERNLGHGFRLVQLASSSSSSFEGIAHHSYLYFGSEQLGRTDSACIANSGRYALFEDASSGQILVFDVKEGKSKVLSEAFLGIPRSCEWQENDGAVSIDFYDQKPKQTFTIAEAVSSTPGH